MRRESFEAVLPASRLCWPCYSGDHSKKHGQIGCLERIGSRQDHVCRCEISGDYRPTQRGVVAALHPQKVRYAW